MKNVLIVGGSYFVGRVFAEEFAKRPGFRVFVLNRGNAPLNLENVAELVCDRHNQALLSRVLASQTWDTVIDFCAYHPHDVTSLFSAIAPGRIKQYILISTVSVYAPSSDLPITEGAPLLDAPQPELGPAADYGYNKRLCEGASMAQCMRRKIPYTHLRPAIIYGQYNYAPRESYFFDLINLGEPVVLPDNDLALFSFVSVGDVARAIQLCVGNQSVYGKALNLAAPDLLGYSRIVDVIAGVMGREVVVQRQTPAWIDDQRIPLPFPLESHLVYSGNKASKALDFTYTSFDQGMLETWQWYNNMRKE